MTDRPKGDSIPAIIPINIHPTGRLITRTQKEKKHGLGGSVLHIHCYWGWLDYSHTPPLQTHALCCVWTHKGPQKIKRTLLLDRMKEL